MGGTLLFATFRCSPTRAPGESTGSDCVFPPVHHRCATLIAGNFAPTHHAFSRMKTIQVVKQAIALPPLLIKRTKPISLVTAPLRPALGRLGRRPIRPLLRSAYGERRQATA